jgi:hypothetical protein
MIPKAYDPESFGVKPFGSSLVVLDSIEMLRAIEFNHEKFFDRAKVDNIGSQLMLAVGTLCP